jgi:hypothetical protein
MKAIVLPRDRVVKIRYDEESELNSLMEALSAVPDIDVQDRGYRG